MTAETKNNPTFYGIGVGPGDPELLTLKAFNTIRNADVVAFITNSKGESVGKNIARNALLESKQSQRQLPICLDMSINRKEINGAYDLAATAIIEHLHQGLDVAFLCEGDPLFFGSFIYLLDRVSPNCLSNNSDRYNCEIIPGITSINAASAQLSTPLTILSEDMAVVSSRSDDQKIIDTLIHYDTVAILKAGPQMPRLASLLKSANRFDDGQYIEYATHETQKIVHDLSTISSEKGPYFSLLLITRNKRQFRSE